MYYWKPKTMAEVYKEKYGEINEFEWEIDRETAYEMYDSTVITKSYAPFDLILARDNYKFYLKWAMYFSNQLEKYPNDALTKRQYEDALDRTDREREYVAFLEQHWKKVIDHVERARGIKTDFSKFK